jgi:hypothetical protein
MPNLYSADKSRTPHFSCLTMTLETQSSPQINKRVFERTGHVLDKLILPLVHLIQNPQHWCNDRAETSPTRPLVLSVGSFCTYHLFSCSSLSKGMQKLVDLNSIRFTGSDCHSHKSLCCDDAHLSYKTLVSSTLNRRMDNGTTRKHKKSASNTLSMRTELHDIHLPAATDSTALKTYNGSCKCWIPRARSSHHLITVEHHKSCAGRSGRLPSILSCRIICILAKKPHLITSSCQQ